MMDGDGEEHNARAEAVGTPHEWASLTPTRDWIMTSVAQCLSAHCSVTEAQSASAVVSSLCKPLRGVGDGMSSTGHSGMLRDARRMPAALGRDPSNGRTSRARKSACQSFYAGGMGT